MRPLLDDHENHSKQEGNKRKPCDEKEHLPLSLKETVYGNSEDNSIRITQKKEGHSKAKTRLIIK